MLPAVGLWTHIRRLPKSYWLRLCLKVLLVLPLWLATGVVSYVALLMLACHPAMSMIADLQTCLRQHPQATLAGFCKERGAVARPAPQRLYSPAAYLYLTPQPIGSPPPDQTRADSAVFVLSRGSWGDLGRLAVGVDTDDRILWALPIYAYHERGLLCALGVFVAAPLVLTGAEGMIRRTRRVLARRSAGRKAMP